MLWSGPSRQDGAVVCCFVIGCVVVLETPKKRTRPLTILHIINKKLLEIRRLLPTCLLSYFSAGNVGSDRARRRSPAENLWHIAAEVPRFVRLGL